MPGSKKTFEGALESWDNLIKSGSLSKPEDIGHAAILCCLEFDQYDEDEENTRVLEETAQFINEAHALGEVYEGMGKKAVVFDDARKGDFIDVLQEPDFSDVVTIGHGTLYNIFVTDDRKDEDSVDWCEVSEHANHLKTGTFIQRHCGGLSSRLSIPLGTFAMNRHSSVFAPVGNFFTPQSLDDPKNDLLVRATEYDRLTYEIAKSLFIGNGVPITES